MKRIAIEEFYNLPYEEMKCITMMGFKEVIINDDNSLSLPLHTNSNHMNLHGTIQGGIQYLICDTALGAYLIHIGRPAVGMNGSIQNYRPAMEGDTLTATVHERKIGRRTGNFLIELRDQNNKLIADCHYSVMFT